MAASLTPEPRRTWLDDLPPSVRKALEPLNGYERRFVQLYCADCAGNGTMAMQLLREQVEKRRRQVKQRQAKRSGKKKQAPVKPLSYAACASLSSQMLTRPQVRLAISAWMDAFAVQAAELTMKVADLAQANMTPFVVVEGGKARIKFDAQTWAMRGHWVKKVRANRRGVITEIELHDAQVAQALHAKILKLGTENQIVFDVRLHYQQLTDEDILREMLRAQQEIMQSKHGADQLSLPAGEQIAVVEKDQK